MLVDRAAFVAFALGALVCLTGGCPGPMYVGNPEDGGHDRRREVEPDPQQGRWIEGDELAVLGTLVTLPATSLEGPHGKAWLAASTPETICLGVQLFTNRGVARSWAWRVNGQDLPRRSESNTQTGNGFWLSFVSCAPRSSVVVEGVAQASLMSYGRSVAEPRWAVPSPRELTRDDAELKRRLDHQVLQSVRRPFVPPVIPQTARATDGALSLRFTRSPVLRDVRRINGDFVAGSIRRRGRCGEGGQVDQTCYKSTYAQDDARLCAQAPDRASCLADVKRHTTAWFAPSSRPPFVVVLVTQQGVMASSPHLNGLLGAIDSEEEARIQAALVTGVWDDSPVLELGQGRYFVYTTPFVNVKGVSMSVGVGGGCLPPRDPSWSDPSLSCTFRENSSSCNSIPSITFECEPKP